MNRILILLALLVVLIVGGLILFRDQSSSPVKEDDSVIISATASVGATPSSTTQQPPPDFKKEDTSGPPPFPKELKTSWEKYLAEHNATHLPDDLKREFADFDIKADAFLKQQKECRPKNIDPSWLDRVRAQFTPEEITANRQDFKNSILMIGEEMESECKEAEFKALLDSEIEIQKTVRIAATVAEEYGKHISLQNADLLRAYMDSLKPYTDGDGPVKQILATGHKNIDEKSINPKVLNFISGEAVFQNTFDTLTASKQLQELYKQEALK